MASAGQHAANLCLVFVQAWSDLQGLHPVLQVRDVHQDELQLLRLSQLPDVTLVLEVRMLALQQATQADVYAGCAGSKLCHLLTSPPDAMARQWPV